MDFLQRQSVLLTKSGQEAIKNAKICVFGCGGVGGYAIEMLVRCGVESLTVVDFDVVENSNINRQIIATTKTIGQKKVEAVKNRCNEINPNCKITALDIRFSQETKNSINFEDFDFIVDAIDDVQNKVLLIKEAQNAGVKIISAMGAGNKTDIPSFKICDIYKTENDGLAKKMRKLLRQAGVESLVVCSSNSKSQKNDVVGSIAYYPAMAGCTVASYVINEIIKGEEKWLL